MQTLWFAIAALVIATYVVLDGFDLAPAHSICSWLEIGRAHV